MKALAKGSLKKKRKLNDFKPATANQEESLPLPSVTDSQPPIVSNGAKLDASKATEVSLSDDTESSTGSSTNSADLQDAIADEEFIHAFRGECQGWLMDHGKAFFHVEALAFLRDQEKKRQAKETKGKQVTESRFVDLTGSQPQRNRPNRFK